MLHPLRGAVRDLTARRDVRVVVDDERMPGRGVQRFAAAARRARSAGSASRERGRRDSRARPRRRRPECPARPARRRSRPPSQRARRRLRAARAGAAPARRSRSRRATPRGPSCRRCRARRSTRCRRGRLGPATRHRCAAAAAHAARAARRCCSNTTASAASITARAAAKNSWAAFQRCSTGSPRLRRRDRRARPGSSGAEAVDRFRRLTRTPLRADRLRSARPRPRGARDCRAGAAPAGADRPTRRAPGRCDPTARRRAR